MRALCFERGLGWAIPLAGGRGGAHAMASAFKDRKRKKREFRRLWITRISAACRMRDINYSRFMNGLKKASIDINRKMLSEIAISDAAAFDALVQTALQAK